MFELDFSRDAITAFMRELPVRKIPGFGRVTERCLEGLGVEVGSDGSLAFTEAHPPCRCVETFTLAVPSSFSWTTGSRSAGSGRFAVLLQRADPASKAYLGIADNTVEPGKRENRKSVGVERWVACIEPCI